MEYQLSPPISPNVFINYLSIAYVNEEISFRVATNVGGFAQVVDLLDSPADPEASGALQIYFY